MGSTKDRECSKRKKIREDRILYWYNKGLSNKQISDKTKITTKNIRYCLHDYNLKANRDFIEETYEIKQTILGSILGDGYIEPNTKTRNSRLRFGHCFRQKEYVIYKSNLLGDLSTKNVREVVEIDNRFKNPVYTEIRLNTKCHPMLNKYQNLSYKKNIKYINYDLFKDIEALGVAIWFMDDGSKDKCGYFLHTCGFIKKDLDILRKILKSKFNIDTNVNKRNSLYIPAKSKNLFTNLIKDYVCESMKYKLHLTKEVLNKSDKLLENPEEDNQQPTQNLNGFGRFND